MVTTKKARLPTLAEILREQLDAVSALKPWKRDPEAIELAKCSIKGVAHLNQADDERADRVIAGMLLGQMLGANESLVLPSDELLRIASDTLEPTARVLEEFYAYQFLEDLSDIGARAAALRRWFAESSPSPAIAAACREAFRCYVYGFHSGSVALLRSVVEKRLKALLGADTGELALLNQQATTQRLYPRRITTCIDKIRRQANRCLHGDTSPTPEENLNLLHDAQEVLAYLERATAKDPATG